MKIRDYFRATLPTFKYCLKICGVIFTAIAAIIAIGISFKENSNVNPFLLFLACLVYGNLLGLFIASVGFISGFYQAKKVFQIASEIPLEIRTSLSLEIHQVLEDYRYHFLSFQITGNYSNSEIWIIYYRPLNEVWIQLQLDSEFFEQINQKMSTLNRKYRKQKIQLNGLGLGKAFKLGAWKKNNGMLLMQTIKNLSDVAETEKLKK